MLRREEEIENGRHVLGLREDSPGALPAFGLLHLASRTSPASVAHCPHGHAVSATKVSAVPQADVSRSRNLFAFYGGTLNGLGFAASVVSGIQWPTPTAWLEFVESMTTSLAWPLAVVVIAYALRAQLLSAIGRLSGIEAFGVKAWFDQKTSALREELLEVEIQDEQGERERRRDGEPKETTQDPGRRQTDPPTDPPTDQQPEPNADDRRDAQARAQARQLLGEIFDFKHIIRTMAGPADGRPLPPRSLVIESWTMVEGVLRGLDQIAVRRAPGRMPPSTQILRDLNERELISGELGKVIREMSTLRNAVAHDARLNISESAANSYAESAVVALGLLESAIREHYVTRS